MNNQNAQNAVLDFGRVLYLNAQRFPEKVALKDEDGGIRTHAELDERTNRLAHALLGLGLRTGDRVACWMDDVVEHVELYGAVAKAGLTLVPVNKMLMAEEATYEIQLTGARALVYTTDVAERLDAVEDVDKLILIAVGAPQGRPFRGHRLEELLLGSSAESLAPPDPDSPFMLCFTSGTTGRPKGAILTHRSALALSTSQLTSLRIPVGGIDLHLVSLSFPATITTHTISHLLAGGTEILSGRGWDTERVLDTVERERISHIYVPGPAVREFAEAADSARERWKTLNSVLYAGARGEPLALQLLAQVIGTRYVQGWGMSENSGGLAVATAPNDVLDAPLEFFSKAGRPIPGAQVKVVDADRRPVGTGVDGELAIKTASLFAGYWDNPEATAQVLEGGWYYTGDMGSMDENGYVSISDRRTNLIVSGGMNIYPAELELVLDRMPGVREVAVVGGPHPRWGQTPIAVVVAEAGSGLDGETVVNYVRTRLASYKKPTRVVFVDEIPRTAGGKVARGVLRDRLGLTVPS